MKLLLSFLSLLLLCAISVNGDTQKKDEITEEYIQNLVQNFRQNRNGELNRKSKGIAVQNLECNLDQAVYDEIHSYQDDVNQIIELFMTGEYKGYAYDLLVEIADTFGPRLTGTQSLDDAINWVVNQSTLQGFNVYTEEFLFPYWVRNEESLEMLIPRYQNMAILGLGASVATAAEGITAEVLVVNSYDDLQSYDPADVQGKIVLYDVPLTSYYETVDYRLNGAIEASKLGAVASLLRSVTDFSIDSPHTGVLYYDSDVVQIPSAAIAIEDATMLHRMQDKGETPVLRLIMNAETTPDVSSRNTIVEIEGSENPEEVVIVSGHLDSWDVGVGAMDDAGGCSISWMAARALKLLNFTPRRTFRTIMFSAEEQGIYGGEAYFISHGRNKTNFQLVMESDFGTFEPYGIAFTGTNESMCLMQEILSLTSILGTTELITPSDTPDLQYFAAVGVPAGSLNSYTDTYLWFHHSEGDRVDVYDSETLDRVAALWAAVSYVAADVSFRLPQDNPIGL